MRRTAMRPPAVLQTRLVALLLLVSWTAREVACRARSFSLALLGRKFALAAASLNLCDALCIPFEISFLSFAAFALNTRIETIYNSPE
jgi:hypothetical protein